MSDERELAIIKYKNARIEELVTENARLNVELTELEATALEQYKAYMRECDAGYQKNQQIARLTARVEQLEAEARRDAARLTFAIEREGRFYRVGDGSEIVFSFLDNADRSIAIHDDIRGADGRAAIDAAIAQEGK